MNPEKQRPFDVEGGTHGGLGTAPAKEFEVEGDLPITANRTAKWWYIAVHNITAMVGAGVLGLPYAMGLLGGFSSLKATHSQLCSSSLNSR